ncbi:hypothetical protein BsWGS_15091 [Bradybaena similaris]
MLCRVYSNLLHLYLSARHIRLQQSIAVIHSIFLENRHVANSFKLVCAVNQTQDCGSTSPLLDSTCIGFAHLASYNMQAEALGYTQTGHTTGWVIATRPYHWLRKHGGESM